MVINHFPLHRDPVYLPRIPRFLLWHDTCRTEHWLQRFPIKLAIYRNLDIRTSLWRNGVRFEEVSPGYPWHWNQERGSAGYLREILRDSTV